MSNNQIALSIDLDDWYHTPLITGSSFSRFKTVEDFFNNWHYDYDFITDSTLQLLDLLDEYKVKATFFVIADEIQRYPKMIAALKNSHHEIACHSLHHHVPIDTKSKELTQTIEEWTTELRYAKQLLENVFQRNIIGYRAPGAYFASWMVPILEQLGFKYDSSISFNTVYNKTNKHFSKLIQRPYWLNYKDNTDSEPCSNILELPLATYKFGNFYIPCAGAFFFRVFGYHAFKYFIAQNLRCNDTMFYIHSLDITDKKIPLSNFKKRPFYWINKGKKTQRRLGKLIMHFHDKIVSCEDLYSKYLILKTNYIN